MHTRPWGLSFGLLTCLSTTSAAGVGATIVLTDARRAAAKLLYFRVLANLWDAPEAASRELLVASIVLTTTAWNQSKKSAANKP